MRKVIRLSIIVTGFTAMASQIVYMRELLVVFYGNEISISFILASWLIAGAIGSALLGRLSDFSSLRAHSSSSLRVPPKAGRSNPCLLFSICQMALALFLPSGIIATRLIKPVLNVYPGQVLPLFPIMVMSFLVLAPICVLMGFMFSLACRIYHFRPRPGQAGAGNGAASIGSVYILEAVGSLAGGAVTSVVLIRFFDAFNITAFFSLLNIAAAFFMAFFYERTAASRKVLSAAALVLFLFMVILWPFGAVRRVDEYSLKKEWQGYDIIASKNSIYGNITITKRGEDYSFFDNGLHLYTIPDRMSSEDAVHLALLEHPDPKSVLLIGGGAGGLVGEILKEGPARVDYVELDPMIITMAEKYLPLAYYDALKDKRVSIKNTDGRFFVKTTKEKYDCVIVHVGQPYTASINRYYTLEFFKEVRLILKEGGILSFGLNSSDSYINAALGEFLSSIYFTLKGAFDDLIVMPGNTAYFLASKGGALTYDYRLLEERTKARRLDTQYVREYYLSSKLSPEKISYIKKALAGAGEAAINRDFHPSSYYYGLIFWTTLFKDSAFSNILRSASERFIWLAIYIFIVLLALFTVFFRRSFRSAALAAMAAGGFSTMAFQILILMAFQIIHGYLFYKLGIILTAFMAGLAAGALFAVRALKRAGMHRIFLLAVQGDFLLYSLILPVFFLKSGAGILFPVMSVIAGFIGGSQFPLVNRALSERRAQAGSLGGLTYGIDLAGSFLGAILTGVFLIPVLGIPKTCVALALINLAVLFILAVNLRIED